MLGCILLIPHSDLPRSGERGVTFDVLHMVLFKIVKVDAVQPLYIFITTLLHSAIV